MARPSVPTATQLLARASQYVLATQHAAVTRSQITRTSAQLGDDRTVDARGWVGELNGGQPSTTGGTDPSPSALKLSDQPDGAAKPARLALVGSLTTTPTNQVGTIRGQQTAADNRYLWPADKSWAWYKNLTDPLDTGAHPNLDAHALLISYNSAPAASGAWTDTDIGAVISGMRFDLVMDAIFDGTAPTRFLLEDSWFTRVMDDTVEADITNGAGYLYNCLIQDAFGVYSARGTPVRNTTTTTYDSCIIEIGRHRWRETGTSQSHCQYAAYPESTLGGYLLGNGYVDKRNANSPKVHFQDCLLHIDTPPVGEGFCDGTNGAWATMGFGGSGRATASNSTLLWGRAPGHPSYPVALDTDAFIPSGMTVLPYQGNESVLSSAVQTWHNAHPQFGLSDTGSGAAAAKSGAGMLAT